MNFDQLIKFGVEQGASDIHLQTGASPLLRIGGLIRTVESPPVSADELRQFIASIKPGVTAESLTEMMVQGLDFSHAVPGLCRFRCNVYSHLGTPAMVMRVVRLKVRTMDELQLPAVLRDITLSLRGLTLVTGTTGSGKTTTLASMVDLINNVVPLQDHHDRGPDRVHPHQPEGDDLAARGGPGHAVVRARAAAGAAARPGRDPGRRGPRQRDDADGPPRRGHRPPGLHHGAQLQRAADDRADPGDGAAGGAVDRDLATGRGTPGGDLAAAGRHPRRRAPAGDGDPPRRPGDLEVHRREPPRAT